jgi:putative transferase (TIGR04331 family)
MGWETEDRYKDLIGIDKIKTSKDCNYNKFIKDSRIIICSYPQTTFVEAMITGKPTILFYNPNFNEYIIEDNTLITKLIEANIIFHSPIKAAEHINKNWDNLNDWWFSKEVKDVRQLFFTTIINKNSNFYKDWIFFLKQF